MATVGGISEVVGAANNLEIENLARFAVEEHNKQQNSTLQFGKVLSAKKQVVSGILYYIALEAVDGDQKNVFEAKVLEKPGSEFNELLEFKELLDA